MLRISEGAAFVAEELVFEERVGERAAVDGYKRMRATLTEIVEGSRDQLLARACFTRHENSCVADRGNTHHLDRTSKRRGVTDELSERGAVAVKSNPVR